MALTIVTGAPGWLGIRLVRAMVEGLADVAEMAEPDPGRTIRCLVQPGCDASALRSISERIGIVEGDLRDPRSSAALCDGAEDATLFHCAGVIHPARFTREFREVNVDGSRHLLEAAERNGVRRAVVVSSNSPLGTNPDRVHLFDEESPYRPYMGYGRSKMELELLVHDVASRGKMETVIVRAPWFYGPDQPPRQNLFFTMIREGKVPLVGDGGNRRSMAYVDNLCQGLLLCERRENAKGETYWIADRRPYTMNEIIETIERVLEDSFAIDVAHKRMRLPNAAGGVAWVCDWLLQRCGLYHQKIHVLSEMNKSIACSIAKAESELGYDPKIELEEGMKRSLQWCFDRGLTI